jgi:hypothetical protein
MGSTGRESGVTAAEPTARPDAGRRRFLTGGAAFAGLALAGALARGTARAADKAQDRHSLVGAWLVYVPKPDGSTAATVQLFHADGTTLFNQNGTADQGAAIGGGLWVRVGKDRFAQTMLVALYDPKTAAHTGQLKIQATLTLDATGAKWTADGRISVYTVDGQLVSQISPAPAWATRIALEPL